MSGSIVVHLSNVTGAGAVQLASSLLPEFEVAADERLDALLLPTIGPLALYGPTFKKTTRVHRIRRILPNALSRALECSMPKSFGGQRLLVLGDIPLRTSSKQAVFLQNRHMVERGASKATLAEAKLAVSRFIFRMNIPCISAVIVQTPSMMEAVINVDERLAEKVHVVRQPPPSWLLGAGPLSRGAPVTSPVDPIRLFYPAAPYPHKNHRMIEEYVSRWSGSDVKFALTVNSADVPIKQSDHVEFLGNLPPSRMVLEYNRADALVFLSEAESYGFPLIEAMWCGLPIVCPDMAYARDVCGTQAIYFKCNDVESLRVAILELRSRLATGWKPDWSAELISIPRSWSHVARECLEIVSAM